jgi:hypothetical protein
MDVPAWAWVLIVVAVVLLLTFAVLRRANAGVEGNSPLGAWKVWTTSRSDARIDDSESRAGGASAVASGDAIINKTKVEKDLTARAGVQKDPPRDPKAP